MKEKRYLYSVVEEMIQNPAYFGYRGGRVEVFDNKSKSGYAVFEARFLIPEEFMDGFRELFDFKKSDLPIMIRWDMPNEKQKG
jgi:hypothetical protein